MKNENLEQLCHSLAHLLAAAVLELWPDTKRAIGPAIEGGFYYDFEFSSTISEEDLPKIEAEMRKILKTWDKFEQQEVSADEAKKMFTGNPYKLELIEEYANSVLTTVKSGNFIDLCRGNHVSSAKDIKPDAFKLTHTAGAYWHGSEKNKMLTRIYAVAFKTKRELAEHLIMQEEAKKRDHRKLGQELDLFTFSELVGPGLPLFLPKGSVIREELEKFITAEKKKLGYSFVWIPHVAKAELYKKSGHLGKYDAMMPMMKTAEGDELVMKAMNCPHHFEIYNSRSHSYRDLPLRLSSNTEVYRNEKSGELSGLLRVISLTQDDTHHFIRSDQVHSEIEMILGLMKRVYEVFGFKDYRVQISIRDSQNKDKYFGDNAIWNQAEKILIEAVKKWGVAYVIKEGEAAFYGPKIDIMVKDAIGRMWQLTTVQLDFVQPVNFQMKYTDDAGRKSFVAVLHVAILGSFERFIAVLIEHFAGAFPVWLAPVQVIITPISDKFTTYASGVKGELVKADLRVELDERQESVGKKIREAELQKVPYVLVVGEKEEKAKMIAVRKHGKGDLGAMKIDKFIQNIQKEINEKKSL